MNKDELKKHLRELIDKADGDINVFIMIVDTTEKVCAFVGVGCAACAAEEVSMRLVRGDFTHNEIHYDHSRITH